MNTYEFESGGEYIYVVYDTDNDEPIEITLEEEIA